MEVNLRPVLLATWNVNSIRARLPRLEGFLTEFQPDVLMLQETKCAPDQFPHDELAACGYGALDHSGGRWCGVAILTPKGREPTNPVSGLRDEPDPSEARWVEADVEGGLRVVSVYVPNGRTVDSEHYEAKIRFLEAAARRASELVVGGNRLVIAGDMNVAPTDGDVWDISAFGGSTHVTERERLALAGLREAGDLVDAHVASLGTAELFTWWDYRGGSFHRGHGMRIDHILLPGNLAGSIESFGIARDFRKGEKPSDHAPVLIRIEP